MSYILDALKRSDSERSMGNIPTLGAAHSGGPAPSSRPWVPVLFGMLLALLLVAFVLLWLFRGQIPGFTARVPAVEQGLSGTLASESAPSTELAPPLRTADVSELSVQTPDATVIVADNPGVAQQPVAEQPTATSGANTARTDVTGIELVSTTSEPAALQQPVAQTEQPMPVPATQIAAVQTGSELPAQQPVQQPVQEQPVQQALQQPIQQQPVQQAAQQPIQQQPVQQAVQQPIQQQPIQQATQQPVQQPDQQAAANDQNQVAEPQPAPSTRYQELTADVRRQLPPLNVNVVSYSPKPQQRFVMVNQEFYYEGENMVGGVLLDEITQDGLVIEFRGEYYLLRP